MENIKWNKSFVVYFPIVDNEGVHRDLRSCFSGSNKGVNRFARKSLSGRRADASAAHIYTFDGHFVGIISK